jgi:integrase
MNQKIKNPNYRRFIDTGLIEVIDQDKLTKALDKIDGIHGNYIQEARALVILLYFTGCRPIEALKIKGVDFAKNESYLTIQIPQSKRGKVRTVFLSGHYTLVKELFDFSKKNFPEAFMFFHFRGQYKRMVTTKSGEVKERIDITQKLNYHFKKWFSDVMPGSIPPYFLRHNAFSKMALSGSSTADIQYIKGSRSIESVTPYIHMSVKKAKDIARVLK